MFSGGGDDARCFQHGKEGTSLHVTLKTSCKLLLTWQREDTPPCHAKCLCKEFSTWPRRNTPPYYVERICNVFSKGGHHFLPRQTCHPCVFDAELCVTRRAWLVVKFGQCTQLWCPMKYSPCWRMEGSTAHSPRLVISALEFRRCGGGGGRLTGRGGGG